MPREEEWTLDLPAFRFRALVRLPDRPAGGGRFLLNLATDRRTSLGQAPYRIAADRLLQAGYAVASFDLPYHGETAVGDVQPLVAMASAMARGEDVFAVVVAMGRALVDQAIARGLALPGRIVASGTSRGGLAALHVMAADPRVSGAAVFAPVTRLGGLAEFAEIAGHMVAVASSAESLAGALAGRPLSIGINAQDERVGTEHCLRFHDLLRASFPVARRALDLYPLTGHALPDDAYHRGAAFLLSLVAPSPA